MTARERHYIVEGLHGAPLGDLDDVLEGLRHHFGEVRSEIKYDLAEWRDFDRDRPLRKAIFGALSWLMSGPDLKYPQCEAYLFAPDGILVCHVGEVVERFFLTVWVSSEQEAALETMFAAQGWGCRHKRSWRVWYRSR